MASPSGDLWVLANKHKLPINDISTVIKYEVCFFTWIKECKTKWISRLKENIFLGKQPQLTWDAHWHKEEAKPESTEATSTGMIPNSRTWSRLLPLEPLPEPSPILKRIAAITSKTKAPTCWWDCLCLKIAPKKVHKWLSEHTFS